jgi:hypothetical protein
MGNIVKTRKTKKQIQEQLTNLMGGVDDTMSVKDLNNKLNSLTQRMDKISDKGLKQRKTIPKDVVYELFNIALASGYIQGKITMIEKIQGSSSDTDTDYIG